MIHTKIYGRIVIENIKVVDQPMKVQNFLQISEYSLHWIE